MSTRTNCLIFLGRQIRNASAVSNMRGKGGGGGVAAILMGLAVKRADDGGDGMGAFCRR